MEKTTLETMKSVIQDWFAECITVDEVYDLFDTLLDELQKQSKFIAEERSKQ